MKPPKTSRTSTFESKEHSKRNHPNHIPRSQSSLESSSKASRNLNKPQIGEALHIQASKASKNFHHKPSNMKNIRCRIIQTTCLVSKFTGIKLKSLQKPHKPQINETLQIQASKALKNFHHKPSNTKNIRRGIIQIIFLDFKGYWNQAQKPLETSTNHKSVKFNKFKPLKPRRTFATNLRRRRTHEEHTKNVKNKGFPTSS